MNRRQRQPHPGPPNQNPALNARNWKRSFCVGCLALGGRKHPEAVIQPGEPYIYAVDDRGTGRYHLACYLAGEWFSDFVQRIPWAIGTVTDTLVGFREEHNANAVGEFVASGFDDDLTKAFAELWREVAKFSALGATWEREHKK